jgi:hypothetical protein
MRVSMVIGIWGIVGILAFTVPVASEEAVERNCKSEEYDIMSVLISSEYGTDYELILINPVTETWSIQTQLNVLTEKWPNLKRETVDSLIVRNSGVSAILEKKFDIASRYHLVSRPEFLQALQDTTDPDWDSFDTTFPDAQGYLTFSRVGFDAECIQALLIFSNAYRCSGTRISPMKRKIAYFNKVDGSWKLVGISRGFATLY